MFTGLYIVWFLFPLALFLMTLWAFAKPWFKVAGKENGRDYLIQTIFCFICFALAVWIDKTENYEILIETISFGFLDFSIARFLLFPAILVALAGVQHYWKHRKDEPLSAPARKRY